MLPKDERGKYIHYKVVDAGTTKDSLAARAKLFFKNMKKIVDLKSTNADTAFYADGKFVISKTASALSHPSGEVLYKLVVELKNRKYRYWLTEFKFIPYQRNRYGNFVPSTVYGVPLEDSPSKLNKTEWDSYISSTSEQAKKMGLELERQLAAPITKKTDGQSIETRKW